MPLYKKIQFNSATVIYVWKITEPLEQLFEEVSLNPTCQSRIDGMKSELHQRGFLSVRKLLNEAGYTDFDLYYDEFGKPHLHDGKHISITHSYQFAAIIISDEIVGIDIELQREKIIRIADKFCDAEFQYLEREKTAEYIKKLTVIWGAKEAIFKIRNEKGISFKDHIAVNEFDLGQTQTASSLHFGGLHKEFNIYFEEVEDFTLVYALEK
ncbi:4'-phosphopantetheinyl transferase family protein [Flavobacterium undicola]|uniref:4'-phosphopantetheinyl transferase family protein n=1 Tax=Flavobacterium undicola TaxID=1932779 RepID=UPI00137694E6|nr:4'-phosphopantetheinyl transferase superfamily protein [Flavobacterium undicola]MBA0882563.1 4'-phosphopantetheinyl transferase superfamily protein [Flavobacterium undicola]